MKMNSSQIKVGILAGTGFSDSTIMENVSEKVVSTPFGNPSDVLVEGLISNIPCVALSRHGRKHSLSPTNINYRANIWALKSVGCTHVLAVTACGSLQKKIKPGHAVIPDQFFDRTSQRIQTFYDGKPGSPEGVLHIPMDKPFCEQTRQCLIDASRTVLGHVHDKGAVVTIEGSRFSSKFESLYFHQLGLSVINMTTVPEVVLAKELGLCYASLAMVTDFDSWNQNTEAVDSNAVLNKVKENEIAFKKVIVEAVSLIGKKEWTDILKTNMDIVNNSKI